MALDEKLRFAHEGGANTQQGVPSKMSVELQIDNSRHLLPISEESISLRRELNTEDGRDAYFLNNRPIVKSDVYNLFIMSGVQFSDVIQKI